MAVKSQFYFILFVLLIIPPYAMADEPAELGEIYVGDEGIKDVLEAPSSFATIIKPEKEGRTFENVSELVSKSAGVTSRSLGGLGQFSTVSIRGSSPEQVTVYLNGVKLNTASGGAFDFSTIPLDSIERIEVIRGGGTAQFGSDAIGGVINIVTKRKAKGRAIELFSGGGSFTTIKLGTSYSEQLKKNSITLAWSHLQSEGDYTFKTNPVRLSGEPSGVGGGKTFTRINNGFLSDSLLANWGHEFQKMDLNIVNDFFFTHREIPGTEEETTLLYPQNPLEAKETIFRNTNSITCHFPSLFIKPFGLHAGVTNNLNADFFKDNSPAIGNPIDITTYNLSSGAFAKGEFTFDRHFLDQILTLRYDYRLDYLNDSSPIATASLTGEKTRHIHSILVQDELSLWDEKLTLLPAFRYEDASDFPDDISVKGGAKFQPVSWFALKGNIERAFRYPNFSELYFPDQGYIRGNPDLRKEVSWNLDAGVGITTPYASLEAAYFRNWIDNSILFVPISATTIAPVNTFDVITQGIETDMTIDPIKYIHLTANYTYLDAHYTSNNNQLPGRPKHELNGRIEFRHAFNPNFTGTLFGELNYKHDMPLNPANTVFLSSRSRADLGLNIKFAKNYYLTFETKNITNVQTYDARGFPLPRRSFFATLGAKWS